MANIEFQAVTKKFGNTIALNNVNVEIKDGEFFVLFGPAGAGKTTTLKTIAGLEIPDEGIVKFDGKIINTVHPSKRNISMVFENYALYPNLTVFDNIASPLRSPKHKKEEEEIKKEVVRITTMLGIEKFLDRLPSQLSNGQRQRVALGRSLIREKPNAFLLDEPLAHLDAKLRNQMRTELKGIKSEFKSTVVYVTHDFSEALSLGDRVGIINNGKILQIGIPDEIYYMPINIFVAKLIGEPEINIIEAKIRSRRNEYQIFMMNNNYSIEKDEVLEKFLSQEGENSIQVGIRPDDLEITEGNEGSIRGEVIGYEVSGNYSVLTLTIDENIVRVKVPIESKYNLGETVFIKPNIERTLIFDQDGNFLTCLNKEIFAVRER